MQRKRFSALLFFFLAVFAIPAVAAPVLQTPASSPNTVAPQSSSAVPVLVLTLRNTDGVTAFTVTSITIQGAGPVNFGTVGSGVNTGVTDVRVARDALSNILTTTPTTPAANQRRLTFQPLPTVAAGADATFYILYDFSSSAALAATSNITLTTLVTSSGNATDGGSAVLTNTVTVSGLAVTQSNTERVPVAVRPDQDKVTIATFSVTMKGENLPAESTQFSVTISNPAGNFVTASGSKAGVTAAYLYKLVDNSPVSVSQLTSFSSASQAVFANISSTALQFVQDTPQTLLIKYDIGSDIAVTKDATVELQLSGISGTGASSALPVSMASAVPIQEVSPLIGGVTYANMGNLVTSQNYGPGNTAPILRFSLNAVNVPVRINEVLMGNSGNVDYVVDPSQTDGVTTIYLYQDSNDNNNFDGSAFGDTLVSTRTLGSSNTAKVATATITNGIAIASNNSETFFAVYKLGEGITVGTMARTAQASLNDVAATSSIFAGETLSLSGSIPASTSPTATVTVTNTNVIVESVMSMVPTSAVQGQRYVPMLYVTLVGSFPISSATMTIRDNQASFLANNTGATHLYLFRDTNQDGALSVSADALLASVATFSSTTQASLSGVPITEGRNRYILAYDIGQVVDIAGGDNVIAAQLSGLSGSSLSLGGELPQPIVAATVTISAAELSIPSVLCSTTGVTNNTTAFTVTVNVQNTSTRSVSLLSVLPRFYFNDASGTDITYQFTVTAADTLPVTMVAGATRAFAFTVAPSQLATSGVVVVDGYVNYRVSTSSFAERIRYQSNTDWDTAATIAPSITVQGTVTTYSWTLPDYISQMTVTHSGQTSTFQSGDAIAASSIVDIQFANGGQFIDPATLVVQLAANGVTQNISLTTSGVFSPNAAPQYTYNRSTGVLEIRNVGSINGTIVINVDDINQNQLPTAYIPFLVASEVKISDLLFYPNPLTPGSNLKIAFNLTQPADLTFYLYNALGRLVWIYQTSVGTLGYQEVDWDGALSVGGNIGSGTYFLKLLAVDANGNRSTAVSKLAVF
jgi:hypothetical protein